MEDTQQDQNQLNEFENELSQMAPENEQNGPKHPMDAKIQEFASEFLQLVIEGNGTALQNWSSRFFVNLNGVVATVNVQYDVVPPQGR